MPAILCDLSDMWGGLSGVWISKYRRRWSVRATCRKVCTKGCHSSFGRASTNSSIQGAVIAHLIHLFLHNLMRSFLTFALFSRKLVSGCLAAALSSTHRMLLQKHDCWSTGPRIFFQVHLIGRARWCTLAAVLSSTLDELPSGWRRASWSGCNAGRVACISSSPGCGAAGSLAGHCSFDKHLCLSCQHLSLRIRVERRLASIALLARIIQIAQMSYFIDFCMTGFSSRCETTLECKAGLAQVHFPLPTYPQKVLAAGLQEAVDLGLVTSISLRRF